MASILCVVAHPDDETLGCGAALARHSYHAAAVHVLVVCEGRPLELEKACSKLGAEVEQHCLPDQRLDLFAISDLAKMIFDRVERYRPEHVYTHSPDDLNLDHRRVAEATMIACRPKPGLSPMTILACEVLSSTEWSWGRPLFTPNWYLDLSGDNWSFLAAKCEALKCYKSQLEPPPHPRNPETVMLLAEMRGREVGVGYAEAFRLLRYGPC